MDSALEQFYTKDAADLVADVRNAMSRRGDFNPTPEHYANATNIFEGLAVLEALTIEGEVLA